MPDISCAEQKKTQPEGNGLGTEEPLQPAFPRRCTGTSCRSVSWLTRLRAAFPSCSVWHRNRTVAVEPEVQFRGALAPQNRDHSCGAASDFPCGECFAGVTEFPDPMAPQRHGITGKIYEKEPVAKTIYNRTRRMSSAAPRASVAFRIPSLARIGDAVDPSPGDIEPDRLQSADRPVRFPHVLSLLFEPLCHRSEERR